MPSAGDSACPMHKETSHEGIADLPFTVGRPDTALIWQNGAMGSAGRKVDLRQGRNEAPRVFRYVWTERIRLGRLPELPETAGPGPRG